MRRSASTALVGASSSSARWPSPRAAVTTTTPSPTTTGGPPSPPRTAGGDATAPADTDAPRRPRHPSRATPATDDGGAGRRPRSPARGRARHRGHVHLRLPDHGEPARPAPGVDQPGRHDAVPGVRPPRAPVADRRPDPRPRRVVGVQRRRPDADAARAPRRHVPRRRAARRRGRQGQPRARQEHRGLVGRHRPGGDGVRHGRRSDDGRRAAVDAERRDHRFVRRSRRHPRQPAGHRRRCRPRRQHGRGRPVQDGLPRPRRHDEVRAQRRLLGPGAPGEGEEPGDPRHRRQRRPAQRDAHRRDQRHDDQRRPDPRRRVRTPTSA